jgi:hypothetical protein
MIEDQGRPSRSVRRLILAPVYEAVTEHTTTRVTAHQIVKMAVGTLPF